MAKTMTRMLRASTSVYQSDWEEQDEREPRDSLRAKTHSMLTTNANTNVRAMHSRKMPA